MLSNIDPLSGGVNFVIDETGGVLTITRDGTGSATKSGTKVTFVVDNLVNPAHVGSMGALSIQTQTSSGVPVNTALDISTSSITCGGKFSSPPKLQLSNTEVGENSAATITFTLCRPLPIDGTIKLGIPEDFILQGALRKGTSTVTLGSHTGVDGGFTAKVNGNIISFTRDGTGSVISTGTSVTLLIENLVNPSEPGATGTFSVQTEDSTGEVLSSADGIPGSIIKALKTGSIIKAQKSANKDWVIILCSVLGFLLLLCCCCFALLFCKKSASPSDNVVLKFQIQGHTNVAAEELRMMAIELSTQRALTVQNFFINGGVDDRMLSSRGFGFDQPLVPDANSPDAHTNLRVAVVLQNVHQLEQVIEKIQQNHTGWKPEQGFGICGSPDVQINMTTGELSHPTIEFKDHAAVLLSECEPSVAAIARVLVYLESHAYHTGHRDDLKKRSPSLRAPATPVQKGAVESELDKVSDLENTTSTTVESTQALA